MTMSTKHSGVGGDARYAVTWKQKRDRSAFLALEDGSVFHGYAVGAPCDRVGEVVFNTGMTGYQEILSDPSYAGQFVVMTAPEIGNTGMNAVDMESRQLFADALLVHDLNASSNWRADRELDACLREQGIPALAGIETRTLVAKLREQGTMKAFISASGAVQDPAEGVEKARSWPGLDGQDYAARVTCEAPYVWDPDGTRTVGWGVCDTLPPIEKHVVALDFGIKWNILRSLRRLGLATTVVPAGTTAPDILALKPDGVFLSNGPADPAALPYAVETVRALLGKRPIMGICLGHQILGLALGAKTERLKFGHHGCNHPVQDVESGTVQITSQNHNFTVVAASLPRGSAIITHVNLNDQTIEGLRHTSWPAFSVQYHPEAGPGPHDAFPLFNRFRAMIG